MTASLSQTLQLIGRFSNLIAICVPLLGGGLVVASSVLMPRGKARGMLTGAFMLLASLGGACLLFAVAGVVNGMPVSAIAPLLLLGVVLTTIMGIFTPEVIREYQGYEVRKLAAEIFRRM